MQQVFVAQHPAEAHLVRGVLEAEGVTAIVQGESLFGARGEAPVTPETLPTVWVLDDSDAARAAEILAQFRMRPIPISNCEAWKCRTCGEHVEAQFAICWNCGNEPR
jgi:hypothetical protein